MIYWHYMPNAFFWRMQMVWRRVSIVVAYVIRGLGEIGGFIFVVRLVKDWIVKLLLRYLHIKTLFFVLIRFLINFILMRILFWIFPQFLFRPFTDSLFSYIFSVLLLLLMIHFSFFQVLASRGHRCILVKFLIRNIALKG